MTWVAGVDGCKDKWFGVLRNIESGECKYRLFSTIQEIIDSDEQPQVIAIDIPIVLDDGSGSRKCDRLAREKLGPRRNSVFIPPVKQTLLEESYQAAAQANIAATQAFDRPASISRQAFALIPKIREVNEIDEAILSERVREIHPELCFQEMNNKKPMPFSKKSHRGMLERLQLLQANGFRDLLNPDLFPEAAPTDDILDACAACWTAERIYRGTTTAIPSDEKMKELGLESDTARIWR